MSRIHQEWPPRAVAEAGDSHRVDRVDELARLGRMVRKPVEDLQPLYDRRAEEVMLDEVERILV
jgi:hypothetical protein